MSDSSRAHLQHPILLAHVDQKNMTYVTNPLPVYLVSQMDRMLENIKEPMIYDKFVFDTVNECIKDYLDGKKTEDQVAKEIDDKVNIFLNE